MLVEPEQSKAARNLLKWRIEDLVGYAKITPDQARNFEQGRSRALEVVEAIHKAYTDNGIRFTSTGGVDIEKDRLIVFEGVNHYLQLLENIRLTLTANEDKEWLLMFASDKLSSTLVIDQHKKMLNEGLTWRKVIVESDNYIIGDIEKYRQIPEKYFDNVLTIVYADKVAISNGANTKTTILTDQETADQYRRIFSYFWDNGVKPDFTTAERLL